MGFDLDDEELKATRNLPINKAIQDRKKIKKEIKEIDDEEEER